MRTEGSRDTSSLNEAVVSEVAERKGVSPEELNPPLYDVIDPDALDALFRGETGQISFEFHGYAVVVSHSGDVTLEPTEND